MTLPTSLRIAAEEIELAEARGEKVFGDIRHEWCIGGSVVRFCTNRRRGLAEKQSAESICLRVSSCISIVSLETDSK